MGHSVLAGELGPHEHADQVILRLLAPGRDDRRHFFDDGSRIQFKVGADVEGLLDGHTEAAGDGQQRDGGGEVDVELGVPGAGETVDEQPHRLVDPVADPPPRVGRKE
jgi:hypothetical protein